MTESIWNDPRITAYVLGEMSDQERRDFESEMESSNELASAVEEARTVTAQLSSLYETESIPPLDEPRRAAIVDGTQVGLPGFNSTSGPRTGVLLAVAAALLLLFGAAPLYYSWQRAERAEMAAATERESAILQLESVRQEVAQQRAVRGLQELNESLERAESRSGRASGVDALAEAELPPAAAPKTRTWGIESLTPALQSGQRATTSAPGSSVAGEATTPEALAVSPDGRALAASGTPRNFRGRVITRPALDGLQPAEESAAGSVTNRLALVEEKAKTSSLGDKSLGDTEVEFVPELGTIVLSGRELSNRGGVRPSRGTTTYYLDTKTDVGLVEKKVRFVAPDKSLNQVTDLTRQLGRESVEFGLTVDEGRGPGVAGDRFEPITDNPFQRVSEHPLSTFSVDVDTASYSKVRDYLARANRLPRPDAVRIEEMINYFSYGYEPPADSAEHPFAARVNVTSCPWNEKHQLARIALKGKTMEPEDRPTCNLVFLIDTSGSMNAPNKLPLVVEGMKLLLQQLNDDDRVAIAVYAGSAGLVLDSTPVQKEKRIRRSLTQLSAGGSTNGGAEIALAYQTARDHFIAEGVNRVILCTDGDFNVGTTGTDELVRMVEKEAKGGIFLSVLGFGMGNHNDAMLEQISGRGNGNYAFIDSRQEARKVLVEQTSGTLVTIAKDVKLQIEFNPTKVSSYRLIGYENRVLAKEDFNDDTKDAGEIGAGHSVTALYELVPAGIEPDAIGPEVDELKYQSVAQPTDAAESDELMTLKLRYKEPDGETSQLVEFPVIDEVVPFDDADNDVRFAAAVASFGMQLRRSPYAGSWTLSDAMNTANRAKGKDRDGLRSEFVTFVQKASELMGEE